MQAAVSQIREMVRMLVNHPSIAVWSCQNESTFHNKFIMDPALEMAVALEDGSRYIRATSEFTEHNYPGWYHGDLRDYALLGGTPILTEFGGQALPKVEDARAMGGDQWPPDWVKLAYHDFQYDQTFLVAGVADGRQLGAVRGQFAGLPGAAAQVCHRALPPGQVHTAGRHVPVYVYGLLAVGHLGRGGI